MPSLPSRRPRTMHASQERRGHATGPAQNAESVRAAYDEVADTYADLLGGTEAEAPVDLAMITHLVSLLAPTRRVLDAGCGAGRLFPFLARLGCDVEGVDLSERMIRRARVDHPDVRARVGSLTDLPHPDASVDGVLSWYSTIHASDREVARMAAEFRRVLRPGGSVLVAFQRGRGVRDVAAAYRGHGHEIALERSLRTADEMVALLATAGLVETARLERAASLPHERDGQAFLIASAP